MVDEFATDVGSLIAVLQKLKPEQKVIGETCKALIHIVETDGGQVLIIEADKRFSRSPLSVA